jgi:hypothetical protein
LSILPDAVAESRRIIAAASERRLLLRLLGGLAIRLHAESAGHRALVRSYPDLDFVCPEKQGSQVESLLADIGYEANKTFNLLNGATRLLFYDEPNQRQIDVFVGRFDMCHQLSFPAERLAQDPLTIPLAELLLTKLQVVQMNEKDVRDICALLLDHTLGQGDAEEFNLPFITHLCSDDWGWWKTVCVSLDKVRENSQAFAIDPQQRTRLDDRIEQIKVALAQVPKTLRWRLRERVGERIKWYNLPEEVQRG